VKARMTPVAVSTIVIVKRIEPRSRSVTYAADEIENAV
jgi:hypothetical protein